MSPRDEWVEDWRIGVDLERERELGMDFLKVFVASWEGEGLTTASKTTRTRYSGSLHALGGYLVARGIEPDHAEKDAKGLLREAIDLDKGPLIHYDNEVWQAELDRTCRWLYRHLMTRGR